MLGMSAWALLPYNGNPSICDPTTLLVSTHLIPCYSGKNLGWRLFLSLVRYDSMLRAGNSWLVVPDILFPVLSRPSGKGLV